MPSMTDRTLPTYLARELYRGIKNATYVEIPSYLGHLAGGPANETSAEYVFVTAQIKKFLSELPRSRLGHTAIQLKWLTGGGG